MGVVPKLESSCFCCSLKTGSFVTAWLLLVGSSVQTGFYAFLVDHMNPPKMCTFEETKLVDVDPSANRDDVYYGPGEDGLPPLFYNGNRPPQRNGRPRDQDAVNKTHREQTNKSYTANTTDGRPGTSSHADQLAANITAGQQTNSSYAANTTGRAPTNSIHAVRNNSTVRGRRSPQWKQYTWDPFLEWGLRFLPPRPRQRLVSTLVLRPCPREYLPFDADSRLLNFDVTPPFDKTILYVNIVIWVIMMAGTILLMAAVYKESASAVRAWLVSEALLLTVATAGAVATAVFMFRAVPVQVGIVTLLNMATHLGIDIYLLMVVENYRRKLTAKEEDEEEDEQVIVTEGGGRCDWTSPCV